MSDAEKPVLAISPSSDRMHIGLAATLLSHLRAEEPEQGTGINPIPWQFFDFDGNPLAVAEEDGGEVLVREDSSADPPGRAARQVLVARVDLVLAHAQLRVDQWLADLVAGGEGPPEDADRVRMVRVQGELADVLTMLAAVGPGLVLNLRTDDNGSWWHNFWAH